MKYPGLEGARIGCVKYLNSRPLICDYDGPVVFDHPSALARMLFQENLDVALVPVFEVLRHPVYSLVEGAVIAADGPVFSVFLAYQGELNAVRRISLDPASLSSAHLLKVLLAEFHGLDVQYGDEGDARLLIGNQAIEFRQSALNQEWKILDLGAEWKRCTGLPFVFALWAIRPGFSGLVADDLRMLKARGVEKIESIVGLDDFATADFRLRYLTEHIKFDVGARGNESIERYGELLLKYDLIESLPRLVFV
jgi:chorismate dehydratase